MSLLTKWGEMCVKTVLLKENLGISSLLLLRLSRITFISFIKKIQEKFLLRA